MSMSKSKTKAASGPTVKSAHDPQVRYGLCRKIRSKGMIVNIDESPENDSSQKQYLAFDKNALPWDSAIWWCQDTCTPVGPDDKPCGRERCVSGRPCFESADSDPVA